MKKIILFLTSLVFFAGCAQLQGYETYNSNGIKFQYPKTLTISQDPNAWNPNEPENQANITVTKKTISEVVNDCLPGEGWEERNKTIEDVYNKGLRSLKTIGMNEDIYRVDTLGCLNTTGNIRTTYKKVSGLNGVVFAKCECQDVGELDSFRMQLLVVDKYDQVYTLDFDFNFGELKSYLKEIRDKNQLQNGFASSALAEDKLYLWHEIDDFLSEDKKIESPEMKIYEDNFKIINKIIDSVEIENF